MVFLRCLFLWLREIELPHTLFLIIRYIYGALILLDHHIVCHQATIWHRIWIVTTNLKLPWNFFLDNGKVSAKAANNITRTSCWANFMYKHEWHLQFMLWYIRVRTFFWIMNQQSSHRLSIRSPYAYQVRSHCILTKYLNEIQLGYSNRFIINSRVYAI